MGEKLHSLTFDYIVMDDIPAAGTKDDAYDALKYALYTKEFKADWYDDSKELEPESLEFISVVTPEQVFAMLKEMN